MSLFPPLAKRSLDSPDDIESREVLLEANGFILKFLCLRCFWASFFFRDFFFFFFFPPAFLSSSDSISLVSIPAFHNLRKEKKIQFLMA
jgi:hypothetical protein